MVERPRYGQSWDIQGAGKPGRAGAGGKATAAFIVIDGLLPSFVNAFGARRFVPGALTILDELPLHIGDHAEYGDDHSPHVAGGRHVWLTDRSEEHTSELQSLMRMSYAVFCLNLKRNIGDETDVREPMDNHMTSHNKMSVS